MDAGLSAFSDIAPFLSDPLVLIGFVLVLFFGIHRRLLKAGIIPPLGPRAGSRVVQLLLRYGFWLALLVVLLGFALQFYRASRETVDVEAIVRVLAEAQTEQLAQLGSEFTAKHEKELQAWKALATQAVSALADMRGNPDAPAGVDEALSKLQQADTRPAARVFQAIAEGKTEPKNARAQAYRHLGTLIFLKDPAQAAQAYRHAEALESGSVASDQARPRLQPRDQERDIAGKETEVSRDSLEPVREDELETNIQAQREPGADETSQAQIEDEGLAKAEANAAGGSYAPPGGLPLPKMVEIPGGQFTMGSETGRDDERPPHPVAFSQPFYLGATEVTFAQYDAFCRDTGREPPGDRTWGRGDRPVIYVDWRDARAYANWLGTMAAVECRLPSEAEWEYAARAGTITGYALPAPHGSDDIRDKGLANCRGCGSEWSGDGTAPVGSFAPNAWGLHDMHGNVWEWVEDCWHRTYEGAPADGRPWLEEGGGDCGSRALRGGSWDDGPDGLRSAGRGTDGDDPGYRYGYIGFRVLCSGPL